MDPLAFLRDKSSMLKSITDFTKGEDGSEQSQKIAVLQPELEFAEKEAGQKPKVADDQYGSILLSQDKYAELNLEDSFSQLREGELDTQIVDVRAMQQ